MKQDDRVFVSGDSSDLWIRDYNCMVSTFATVQSTPANSSKKVLLKLDSIGGDENIVCSVRKSRVSLIDKEDENNEDVKISDDNKWLWQDATGIVRHLRSMSSYHLKNLMGFLQECGNPMDTMIRIKNIETVLKERNYDEQCYAKDVEYYEVGNHNNGYDETCILYDALWILGSGIDKEEKWWSKYE